MRVSAVLAVASATLAFAQTNSSKTYTAEDLGAFAGEVTTSQRSAWCRGQQNTCRELCSRLTDVNDCSAETLEFECKCDDGTTPDLREYVATVPTYICDFVYDRCVASRPNDLDGQEECTANRDSGCPLDDRKSSADEVDSSSDTTSATASATSTESSASAEATGDASGTASADSADATTTSDDSFAAATAAPVAGAAAAAMGLLAYLI